MITQSEEEKRAEKWLTDTFRREFSEFHIISLANEFTKHAAEARADQREACARKSKKVINKYFRTSGHNKMMQGRIENACLNAVEKSDG